MTRLSFPLLITVSVLLAAVSSPPSAHALGSGATLAVAYGTATVCAIVADQPTQRIICYRAGNTTSSSAALVPLDPNVSFSTVAAGDSDVCALRSGGYVLLCWNTNNPSLPVKRLYYSDTVPLKQFATGGERICATFNASSTVTCWRPVGNNTSNDDGLSYQKMEKITSGAGFSCGIVNGTKQVSCWGNETLAKSIAERFGDIPMLNIEAGFSHICGVNTIGDIVCVGDNSEGQLNILSNKDLNSAWWLALGKGFSCAIRRLNGIVVCWGSLDENAVRDIAFSSIVSGLNFMCGVITSSLSITSWE